ncbi:hypothetical protein VNO77_04467 [Canavalia gladiata]|uniref:G-patch domain-containing protein n=1 Tax=Canavalia gladiata TaxID=3824 RepID=A0AAN9MXD8_CANGL
MRDGGRGGGSKEILALSKKEDRRKREGRPDHGDPHEAIIEERFTSRKEEESRFSHLQVRFLPHLIMYAKGWREGSGCGSKGRGQVPGIALGAFFVGRLSPKAKGDKLLKEVSSREGAYSGVPQRFLGKRGISREEGGSS